ncbi:cobalamin-binding protein [candidate division KSB1 bacterium]|nr:cobalamin-binding protein [candidate division KSB1 bacterium]
MSETRARQDTFGFLKPALDRHDLGLTSVAQLLRTCGLTTVFADETVCQAANRPEDAANFALIEKWLRQEGIARLGFSFRLDPDIGVALFGRLLHGLREKKWLHEQGGPLRQVCFAGLPRACELVRREWGDWIVLFRGDESMAETLDKLGIQSVLHAGILNPELQYDRVRFAFANDLFRRELPLQIKSLTRPSYSEYGTEADTLVLRLKSAWEQRQGPLLRAHMGPYLPERHQAVHLFLKWAEQMARGGHLDILSIGTSQLSQSHFGQDWNGLSNGGGVPVNSEEEFAAIWRAARPMLVRTYAGSRNILQLAKVYERTIHQAWHALSFWWFSQLDGRGPNPVLQNLREHLETLKFIAHQNKPFEPNIPHHFAFRGADDVTYIVSAVLAARVAKSRGIRHLVLQNMLNTPKYTWSVQDLAKSRAMLTLVRELEDRSFRIIYQPRAGLDYFSPDPDKARRQLAAVTALIDDVEPHREDSPPVIHVVGYSEAAQLATPEIVEESLRITRAAIAEWRRRRSQDLHDCLDEKEVAVRMEELITDTRRVLYVIDRCCPPPYSAEDLHRLFAAGFLPVPHLWNDRDLFPNAIAWDTAFIDGGIKIVNEKGLQVPIGERLQRTMSIFKLDKR